jgi:hypothetical protein
MLMGTACAQNHALLKEHLMQMAGVRQVDLNAVPDHVLVDADRAIVSPQILEAEVTRILSTTPPCRAEIMKSCISANLHLAERARP